MTIMLDLPNGARSVVVQAPVLIPAGTGGATQQIRRVASDRDNIVIEAREEAAREAVALAAPTEEPAEE